jgi:HTH-type transcriptional regulator / antitoxin HipB
VHYGYPARHFAFVCTVRLLFVDLSEFLEHVLPRGKNNIEAAMTKEINYEVVRSAAELGELARAHRKSLHVTLERISGLGNVSSKFLSERERGKDTAEIGKVFQALRTMGLEVVIQP